MGAFVAGLDRIRAEYPCAQEVVHHTGKNGIVERGSTALAGAALLAEAELFVVAARLQPASRATVMATPSAIFMRIEKIPPYGKG